MNIEKFLIDKGYKCYPQIVKWPYIKNNLWQKEVESKRVCECNNRLHLNIREYEIENEYNIETYTIEIVAEYNGMWWTLNSYSLSKESLIERHDEIHDTLIRLFNEI